MSELKEVVVDAGVAAGAPPVAAPAVPATPAAADPVPSEPVVVDALDAEIAANEAALAAASGQPAATPAVTPASPAPVGGSAPAPAAKPEPTVPLKAFTRMREEANRWRDAALVNEGAARAATAIAAQSGQPAAAAAQPEKTAEEQIAELRGKKAEFGAQFDAGKITAAEMTKQQDAIEDEIFTIREGLRQPAVAQAASFDSNVETHANTVVTQHPVLVHLNEQQIQNLTADAYERAQLEGKPIGKGALETMRLRELVGQMATQKYAQFYIKPVGGGAAPQPAPQGGQPAGALSPAAQARDAKLALQGRMPPDATAVGSPDAGTQPGDAEVLASLSGLSEDEQIRRLDAMPGVVQRLTGISKL